MNTEGGERGSGRNSLRTRVRPKSEKTEAGATPKAGVLAGTRGEASHPGLQLVKKQGLRFLCSGVGAEFLRTGTMPTGRAVSCRGRGLQCTNRKPTFPPPPPLESLHWLLWKLRKRAA